MAGLFTAGAGRAIVRTLVLAVGLLGPIVVLDVVGATLLDPLPFRRPSDLIVITGVSQPRGEEYADLFAGSPTLEGATTLRWGRATWSRPGRGRRVTVLVSDHSLLSLLGLSPLAGRGFERQDLEEPTTALVSSKIWAELEADDVNPRRAMELNGRLYEIIGVAPDALSRFGPFDVILPRNEGRSYGPPVAASEGTPSLLVGRRQPGRSLSAVQENMELLQRRQERPVNSQSRITIEKLSDRLTTPALPTLQVVLLSGAVLFLLALVTIGMVAAMEGVERLDEFAIRSALGATQQRLRLEAVQPWLLAMLPASLAALAAAIPLSRVIRLALPSGTLAFASGSELAAGTVAFGVLLSLVAALCSAIPNEVARRSATGTDLTVTRPRLRGASGLVSSIQVTLSVALLCASAVATRALLHQSQRDLGILESGVNVLDVHLGEGLKPGAVRAAWARLGVETAPYGGSVAVGSALPWESRSTLYMSNPITQNGHFIAEVRVGRGFFPLLGMRLIDGVDPFASTEETDDVVISREVSRQLGLGVGSRISIPDGGGPELRRVAGVVGDVQDPSQGPAERRGHVYLLAGTGEAPGASTSLFVRGTAGDALQIKALAERCLPAASISEPLALAPRVAIRLEKQRAGAYVLAGYALLAALIVALGLSGLMRRRLAQERREVAVRLALGASPTQIDRAMLGPLIGPAALGIGMGVWVGFHLSKAVAWLMPWAKPLDPVIYLAGAVFGGVMVLISVWPSLRAAAQVQPGDLLRRVH